MLVTKRRVFGAQERAFDTELGLLATKEDVLAAKEHVLGTKEDLFGMKKDLLAIKEDLLVEITVCSILKTVRSMGNSICPAQNPDFSRYDLNKQVDWKPETFRKLTSLRFTDRTTAA